MNLIPKTSGDRTVVLQNVPLHWILTILFGLTLVLHSLLHLRYSKAGRYMRRIPGPISLPIVGGVIVAILKHRRDLGDVLTLLRRMRSEYGDVFGLFVGHKPTVFLCSHNTASTLLRSKETDKASEYEIFRTLVGDGVFLSKGEKWRQRRRLISPSANSQRVSELLPTFNKHAAVLIQILGDEVADRNMHFNLEHYIARCYLDLSFECLTGTDVETQRKRDSAILNAVESVADGMNHRLWTKPYLLPEFMWKISGRAKLETEHVDVVKQFFSQVIEEHRKVRQGEGEVGVERTGGIFLDILLDAEESHGLTDVDIYEETVTMITGARDTSTRATLFTLFMLAVNPEVYAKVRAEIDGVLEANGGDITKVPLNEMKYLECCLKESMRLYPPGMFLGRKLREDMELENGMVIPGGTSCIVVAAMVHRDPLVYQNPETFRPERFLKENAADDPYTFLAFSAGRRNCPGQKFGMLGVKAVLAHVLATFDISSYKKMKDVKCTIDVLLKPKEFIPFLLKRRVGRDLI